MLFVKINPSTIYDRNTVDFSLFFLQSTDFRVIIKNRLLYTFHFEGLSGGKSAFSG